MIVDGKYLERMDNESSVLFFASASGRVNDVAYWYSIALL